MPEGDVVHRAAVALRVLVGERVEAASPHPRGVVTGVARAVDGCLLESVDAVGKNLLLRFEGGLTVRSHLRMSGRWRVQTRGERIVGRPWLVLRGARWEAVQWNGPVLEIDAGIRRRVGPDVLGEGLEPDDLVAAVRRAEPGRPLGEVLLDQRVVSGIGNIWAAESLWRACVSPWLPLGEATDEELAELLGWVRSAMGASVAGSQSPRAVYRRVGRPCSRCGEGVRSRGLGDANRTAYWCSGCQRGPSPQPTGRPACESMAGGRSSIESERRRGGAVAPEGDPPPAW
jgi:endonuclease-8